MRKILKLCLFFGITFVIYLSVLYFLQNELIFYPSKDYQSPRDIAMPVFQEQPLIAWDKMRIMTWYSPGQKDKPAILFFHGNAGQISGFAKHFDPFIKQGYSVLIMEYRGFGNTFGVLEEETVLNDAVVAFDFLKQNGHERIVFYGYSFGTAVAMGLTGKRTPSAIVLTAPFYSLERVVKEKPVPFASFVLKNKFLSHEHMVNIHSPLLIIHGKKDQLIPFVHGRDLFELAPVKQKQIYLLEEETHSSIFFKGADVPLILKFLEEI